MSPAPRWPAPTAATLLLLAVELALLRRADRRLPPVSLAAGPAAVVALAAGLIVFQLFAGIDGGAVRRSASILAVVSALGGGAAVLWRGCALLPGRGFSGLAE